MIDKEFDWYLSHQPELVEKYNGKYLLIRNETVVGSYNSTLEASIEGKKNFTRGTYLIQLCTPGKDAYTKTFHFPLALA